ncbi:MAG: YwaF family protein [Firmicutes bacterium]|nr:YwaF family protein [Bacillota bacterium]
MKPFSPMFIALFILGILLLWVLTKVMKNATDGAKRAVYIIICLLTVAGFFAYKYYLSMDTEFNIVASKFGGFNWWQELPLHLCNIHMILMPIAVATNKRSLLSFSFFVAPLGALMALLMPTLGFSGYSILIPRILGFYGTHVMVIVEALALYTLGFYKPEYKDIPQAALITTIVATVVFGINLVLKFLKLCPNPNYFFLMQTEGNPILELFYKYIPYPFLYALPCLIILAVYMLIVTFVIRKFVMKNK